MKKLHFALIGAGKMGTRWMGILSKYASLDCIVDPAWSGSCILEDALHDKEIDAVLIATPHKYHYSITKQALQSGKHILCEKPGGITSKEIKENMKLAKKKGLIYKIGYNYRFHDAFIKARKLYDKGAIGKLLFIRARHGFGGREGYEKEWRINKEMSGGGHLHDQGVHMIDMARSFMGNIDQVRGFMANTYWNTDTEDNAFVLLKRDSVIASIHSSLIQWKRMHTFEIYGDKGYLIIEGLGMRYGDGEKLITGKRTANPDIVKEKTIICNPIADNSLALELKEFVSAIQKGTPLGCTPQDAYETLKVVEEVYKTNQI